MMKQVIIIRKDLDMGKGKLAAQTAHASLDAALKLDRDLVEEWVTNGAKKIVVKVDNEKALRDIVSRAKREKLPVSIIKDAGHTQVEKGTTTAAAIGPAEERKVDRITGKLKLL